MEAGGRQGYAPHEQVWGEQGSCVEAGECAQPERGPSIEMSERLLRSVVRNAYDVVTVLETDGTIRYVNPAVERVLGYRPEEMIGTSMLARVHPEDLQRAQRLLGEILGRTGVHPPLEFRMPHRDGSWRHFEHMVNNLLHDPDVGGIVVNSRDTTERKEAEEAQARLAAIVESSDHAIYGADLTGRVNSWNPGAEKLYGYTADEIVGRHVSILVPLEHQDEVPRVMERLMRGERAEHLETVRVTKDGRRIDVSLVVSSINGSADETVGFSVTADDITERKRAEEALKRSEASLAESQRIAHLGSWEYDFDRNEGRWSDEMYRIFGFEPGEFVPGYRSFFASLHPGSRDALRRAIREALYKGVGGSVEYRIVRPSGEVRIVHTRYEPILDPGRRSRAMFGTIHDITERKQAGATLKESEERYRLAARASNEVIWDYNIQEDSLGWAGALSSMFGFSPEEIGKHGAWWEERLHPEDRQDILSSFDEVLGGGGESWSAEYRFRRADGTYSVVTDRAYVVRDETGEPIRMVGSMMDITRRKEAEKSLHEAEKRFRTLVEQMPAVTYIEALDEGELRHGVSYVSPQIEEQLGYTPEEWVQNNDTWVQLLHPEDRERVLDEDARTEETGEPFLTEYRILTRDGKVVWLRDEAVLVRDEDGDPLFWQGVQIDITERKRVEQAVEEAREAAEEANRTKSEFLANMSHEIRTPMNGVIGMTDILLRTDLSQKQRHCAEMVRLSGKNLLAIINDILDFSKMEAGKLEIETIDFDLRSMVEHASALLADYARKKGLELMVSFGPEVPTALRGDPGRLRQVLVNLLSNAVKFTEEGEVVLRVSSVGDVEGEGDGAAARIRFEVSDTGIGMTEAERERLFEAFSQADASTTRKYGGTGLGLTISRQLVELMGGQMGVESEPGEGSTFWFALPLERQPRKRILKEVADFARRPEGAESGVKPTTT